MFVVEVTENARVDIEFHRTAGGVNILKKIAKLLEELREHPFSGTGKPEALKYDLAPKWSRRINKEHRMVYHVEEHQVYDHSLRGHYQ